MVNKKITFDIIWYLSGDWDTDHRRQMITSFAKNMIPFGKILCINRPVCLITTPFFNNKKFIQWVKGQLALKKITENLYIYTPFVFIYDQIALKMRILAFLNRKILSFLLKKIINKIGFNGEFRLGWVYIPTQFDYLCLIGDNEYVYECFDDYSEFKFYFMNQQQLIHYGRKLANNALLVFNTAHKLYEKNVKINPRSYYISNAVNVNLFTATKQNNSIPYDMKILRHPIVGFIGNVDSNFVDCNLIKYIVSNNPSFSFVFLGKINKSVEVDAFLEMSNVHYLGFKRYEDLPSYVLSFDVGIIPFKVNEITRSLNPLKVYEFMAAGCPVVATDIPELQKFSNLISIAKNYNEFDSFLKRTLSSDLSELKKSLLKEINSHSWDSRTNEMISYIQRYLLEKCSGIMKKVSE